MKLPQYITRQQAALAIKEYRGDVKGFLSQYDPSIQTIAMQDLLEYLGLD